MDVLVHTTNAVDFAAFHDPAGKIYIPKQNPERVRGVLVHRHPVDHDPGVLQNERDLLYGDLSGATGDAIRPVPCGPISSGLRRAIEHELVDVIHTTAFPHENIFVALRCAKLARTPVVITPFIHGENPRYMHESVSLLKHFDRVLVCSDAEKTFLEKVGVSSSNISRITMGVDVETFDRASTEKFFRVTNLDPGNSRIVLFSGHKNYEKGAITLIRAVPEVARAHPNTTFIMLGPATTQYNMECNRLGNFKKHVLNLTPSNLSGYFDSIKLGAFKACDVYAMPSRSDAYGIAYLEAWASKKPVISSSIPAMQELFQDGIEGYHVPFDDVALLASTINQLLSDYEHSRWMGLQGRAKIEREHLSWEHVAGKVLDVYRDLVRRV